MDEPTGLLSISNDCLKTMRTFISVFNLFNCDRMAFTISFHCKEDPDESFKRQKFNGL